jgi:DNA mismatch repair protein MutS2
MTAESQDPRAAFAAGVLGLDEVLELFAREVASSLGRRVLLELEPRPREGARQALARVRAAHALRSRGAEPPLAGLTDLAPAFARGLRGFDEEQLSALRSLIEARGRIEAWGAEHGEEARALLEVLDRAPDLSELHARLEATLDGRGRLRTDASPLHERLSREVQDQSSRIDQRLKEILGRADVRAVLSDASVHRRQGRPVLAVKARLSGRVRGLVHDRSGSGESVFIEPSEVVQPGNRLAELRSDLRREAERIMLELARRVLDERERIEAHALLLAEVELAVVGARFMARHQAVVALQPGDEGASAGLSLRAARHPLLIQQVVDGRLAEVVPIDLRVGDDFDLLLITGPNTGGKTVAMKTAGLFAVLTRLGLPVPAAEGTTVPLYARVLADIGDEQEIRQNLSTFASHLVRIQVALDQADPESLVLLDELGGGTDPEEGAALGLAVLETLLARGAHTLVSTHIGRLKEFAWRRPRAENACTAFDLESLAPLYQVHLGTPGESGALVIARRLGLDGSVVARAQELLERQGQDLDDLFADVRTARIEAERVRKRTESERDRAREEANRLAGERERLERRSEQVEAEAQKGLEERVREAARGLERARALLPQLGAEARRAMEEVLDRLQADLSGASLTDRRRTFLAGLGKGSLVYLPRYRKRVLVHKLDREREEVVCKLGAMKVRVPFDEVTPYESL